jgi:hypothetical protein
MWFFRNVDDGQLGSADLSRNRDLLLENILKSADINERLPLDDPAYQFIANVLRRRTENTVIVLFLHLENAIGPLCLESNVILSDFTPKSALWSCLFVCYG